MRKKGLRSIKPIDVVVFLFVTGFVLLILIPFINVVMISLTTKKSICKRRSFSFRNSPRFKIISSFLRAERFSTDIKSPF